ncbi:hypothetical protein DM01DRAFT_1338353 [Hesseltinella vesiculosa]|uniref:Ubiquitin-conjugating enzyme E2-binding protein n=1 Tax=Hesseltinella vesiculosa TaxID=101127 RepID=A0A1X2GAJ7_9FUNG|nr:hypothetical protein DM01DRAFT_1338353 [Hesseltinella vesiculosa]
MPPSESCYAVFAEKLTNLNILRVTVGSPEPVTAAAFTLQQNRLVCDQDTILDLSLYHLASQGSCHARPHETKTPDEPEQMTWDIKIPLQPTPAVPMPDDPAWWSAKDLLTNGWTDIACRHCQNVLVHNEAFTCKDMPSEHWFELVECWICHEAKPEEHRRHLKPILARPGSTLVGSFYFFLDAHNLQPKAVVPDQELLNKVNWDRGTLTKWISINCGHCGKVMGDGQFERQDGCERVMAVKLFKYCVQILPKNEQLTRPEFINMLVGDMMEAAKAHATRKFLIQGRKTSKIYALIWLFNWDTTIVHNDGFKDDHLESDTTHRFHELHGLKILYADGDVLGKQWAQDRTADHLIYPDTYCHQLMQQLQASSALLPPALRKLHHPALSLSKDFHVGFLPR